MPRYNTQPTLCPEFGLEPFPLLCRVQDATGRLLDSVIACDTDTGEVLGHELDKEGNLQLDRRQERVLTYRQFFSAPLAFVPLDI